METTTVAGVLGLDPTMPRVEIELRGVKHHLAFDLNSIALLEEKIHRNVLTEGVDFSNITQLRWTLWSALLLENPDITERDAGAMVHPRNWALVSQKIIEALGASQAEPEPDAEKTSADPPNA